MATVVVQLRMVVQGGMVVHGEEEGRRGRDGCLHGRWLFAVVWGCLGCQVGGRRKERKGRDGLFGGCLRGCSRISVREMCWACVRVCLSFESSMMEG